MEHYDPYSRLDLSSVLQLLCTASPVAASLQGHYGSLLWWLFCLCSHWKPSLAVSIHREDDIHAVWPSRRQGPLCVAAVFLANCVCVPGVAVLIVKVQIMTSTYRHFDKTIRFSDV